MNIQTLMFADKSLSKVEDIFAWVCGWTIFALMIAGTVQIIARKVFNFPIFGYIDVVEQSAAIFAFFGAAYCQRLGGHVRMEMFISRARGRTLWVIELITTLIAAIVIAILITKTWDHFLRAWEFGDSTINADLPIWPTKLMVPIAFSILLARLIIQVFGFTRLVAHPDAPPIAVPLIEDVEEIAAKEIKDALGDEALHATELGSNKR
ncbi:MAG TPA: TRAP transporter small permease [Gammaproteobacteria bacterium]|nr:TRAP transporter small permease [Gammaproteobacteria bacterium]